MRISDWSSDVCSSDLRRAGAGHLAQHRAAVAVDLGRRLAAVVAGVPAGRHRGPAAGDPGLHVLVVLGVPRQGGGGFGVSLDWAGIGDSGFRNPARGALCFIRSRSEEHTSELQSLMLISYAVFCLNNKHNTSTNLTQIQH